LRFGIVLPVVFRYPGTFAPWESDGGIAELRRIAEAADRFGFTHLTCSDHVGVPEPVAEVRGGTYWDPLATLGYLAACTRRIGLATNVLVLGYHHPLEIAKRYGTLDVVSGGRLILGLGVGTLEEEFALLGAPFADRGARADDAIAALRASLGVRVPTYHGPFYDFEGFVIEPHAVQSRVPLWIGGKTKRSLRRAVTLADGWVPTALSVAQMGEMLKSFDLPPGFEVVLGPPKPLDPMGEPDEAVATVERLQGIGTTIVHSTFVHHSPEHYIEQLEALAKLFGLSPTA
jgi:probable F420-dependent oxidoreductase